MNHVDEQSLLLHSHRSLGVFASLGVWWHMRSCPECRSRYASMAILSSVVAGAVRPGLAGWKPTGLTFWAKAIIATVAATLGIIACLILALEIRGEEPAPAPAASAPTLVLPPLKPCEPPIAPRASGKRPPGNLSLHKGG